MFDDKTRIFVFTIATPIINQGKWTCDQQQQKLIGVLTFEETELERATRLLVLTWSYSGDFFEYKSYFVSYLKVMTWLLVTLITFLAWPGYWYDLGPRQNLPSKCLCLGQMAIPSSWILDTWWIPALANFTAFWYVAASQVGGYICVTLLARIFPVSVCASGRWSFPRAEFSTNAEFPLSPWLTWLL